MGKQLKSWEESNTAEKTGMVVAFTLVGILLGGAIVLAVTVLFKLVTWILGI
jgi:hypothetical protein